MLEQPAVEGLSLMLAEQKYKQGSYQNDPKPCEERRRERADQQNFPVKLLPTCGKHLRSKQGKRRLG